jgi:hypothetical protein
MSKRRYDIDSKLQLKLLTQIEMNKDKRTGQNAWHGLSIYTHAFYLNGLIR